MPPTTRVAIIGTGMIGKVHRRAARNAGATVVGVLGSSAESSVRAASMWEVPRAYRDLDELFADRPDFVQICTPNDSHHRFAMDVIAQGINVVCEKPLATSANQARDLTRAAEHAGVVATVPFVYRYHPLVREIRARYRAGEFGELLLVHGSYLQDWLVNRLSTSWRIDAGVGGASRAFADIGSHWCDLVAFITGEEFVSVCATTSVAYDTRPAPTGESFGAPHELNGDFVKVQTEDTALATFRTASGTPVNTVISQVSAGRKNRLWLEVDGSDGSAVFDQEQPDSVWLGREDGATLLRRGEGHLSADQARLVNSPAGHPQGYADAFTAFLDDSYAAGRGEPREGLPTFHDGLLSALLVDAVMRSSDVEGWVEVGRD